MIKQGIVHQRIGAIFEWSVCHLLAQKWQCEEVLLNTLHENYFKNLEDYQRDIYNFSSEKYYLIIQGARETAHYIDSLYGKNKYVPFPLRPTEDSHFTEADIFLSGAQKVGISLKFSFNHSFINTKSAGYQSILSQYFSQDFSLEKQLKISLATNHYRLMEELSSEFSFKGDFSTQDWMKQGLPILPGELEGQAQKILHHYYSDLAGDLYQALRIILDTDLNCFVAGIKKIMGFSDLNTIQVVTRYDKESGYFNVQHFDLANSFFGIKSMTHQAGASYINIEMDSGHILRLRVKPMDKFIVPGIKVNGALLYK